MMLPSLSPWGPRRRRHSPFVRSHKHNLGTHRMNSQSMAPLAVMLLLVGTVMADERISFEKDIAPIFSAHCARCHSEATDKGDFSIETFDDARENAYVVEHDPDGSHLLDLITRSSDGLAEMPKEGEPLSPSEVSLVRQWIAEGAVWPENVRVLEKPKADLSWWSLQPLAARIPIDTKGSMISFLAELAERGLKLNPPADRRTLIRRATYDLIGLPPTPEEVEAFVSDPDANAYEQLVDRLLASPHYGEHWGRHWLDVVRFGESNGFERNVVINDLWPFRDYVIRSINEDKPFDEFIREHLAGDVFAANDPNVTIATAFLVAGPYDDVGNQDAVQAAQIRANTLDEIIRSTSEAFLGLTVGCARCHNHKFDPITQADYYSLLATFAGIRHGSATLATAEQEHERTAKLMPLVTRQTEVEKSLNDLHEGIRKRGLASLSEHSKAWTRPSVDRRRTEDVLDPVPAKFVRLVCDANDVRPQSRNFGIDEMEVWSHAESPRNVALASSGGQASGKARSIEDYPDAYGAHHAIDGKTGTRFISAGPELTIELAELTTIDRIVFSSARGESNPGHGKFNFVAEYHIEISTDGENWTTVASGADRAPVDYVEGAAEEKHAASPFLQRRLEQLEITAEEKRQQAEWNRELARLKREIAAIPSLPTAWIGRRVAEDAKGPFHLYLGGSPQRLGDEVVPASLASLDDVTPPYRLSSDLPESERRLALANWIIDRGNPLTPRVLANRVWHYHFGAGIVGTPNDFGYMGERPSHPELLDWLASLLMQNDWRIKPLHKIIMMSKAYQQSSDYDDEAAKVDRDARLLWRFPPRRLSAEQVRDTMLSVGGKLTRLDGIHHSENAKQAPGSPVNLVPDGGPGFRLYHFMQDNVCTYVPLNVHGPETYRRAVYHQNARASVVDLMTEFDQPDCTYSSPRRSETTTPLQALTMLNHRFTYDMALAFADRLKRDVGDETQVQVERAYQLCYSRDPTMDESVESREFISEHGLAAFCRVLMNTSELIYVR